MSASTSTAIMTAPITSSILPVKGLSDTVFYGKASNQHHHHQQQQQQQRPTLIQSISTSIPKKPMRPLTAYHIFFQIEREYIIQTMAGEDADKSIHDNKVYLDDVPARYKNIKLLPDWYAGPGKRQKRKHRKQHGKIGFLELSRVISTRWAQLGELDPETKAFVQEIAKGELDEYYKEMKEYKELTKDMEVTKESGAPNKVVVGGVSSKNKGKSKKQQGNSVKNIIMPAQQQQLSKPSSSFMAPHLMPDPMISSSFTSLQLKNDIDYFLSCIDNKTQHLLPSSSKKRNVMQQHQHPSSFPDNSFYGNIEANQEAPTKNKKRKNHHYHRQDSALSVSNFGPLLEGMPQDLVEHHHHQPAPQSILKKQRRMISNYEDVVVGSCNNTSADASCGASTASSADGSCSSSPSATFEVDICDDEILQLWKSHN